MNNIVSFHVCRCSVCLDMFCSGHCHAHHEKFCIQPPDLVLPDGEIYITQLGDVVDRRVSLEQVDWRQTMEHIQQGDEVGSLNMQDTPQDASDIMCLVVQCSDLEEQDTVPVEQYKV